MAGVQAALLGLSHPHSLAHLRTLQQLSEVTAIHLWDEDRAALAAAVAAQPAKVVATTTVLDELLNNEAIFFVIAAVRNDRGPDLFVRVLEAGKHLLAEKPIGRQAVDTARVIDVAQRTGRQLGVCYQNRARPAVNAARRLIGEGIIGELISVEMRLITTQVQFRNPQHWLFNQAQAGGGMLSWLGCHYLDLMRYISGDEAVSVMAEMATRSGEAIDVEDVATLALRLRSGAVGSLHVGYMLRLSGGGYHNSGGYDAYAAFNGRLGRIYWSEALAPNSLHVESAHPTWQEGAPIRKLTYPLGNSPAYGGLPGEQFVRDFILAAQGQGQAWTTGADALYVARLVDAAYESSRSGQRIPIEGRLDEASKR